MLAGMPGCNPTVPTLFFYKRNSAGKTLIAAAFALPASRAGFSVPFKGGWWIGMGLKLILSIGTLLFGFGFMWFSWIDSLLEFYLLGLIAVGSSLGGFATVMVAIVNWFDRHRSKAVAWSQLGYSIGGMAVPLVVLALEAWGWRFTAFMSGVLVLLLGLPMAQVVRHRPQPFGAVPDGELATQDAGAPRDVPKDLTARQAMATLVLVDQRWPRVCAADRFSDHGPSGGSLIRRVSTR